MRRSNSHSKGFGVEVVSYMDKWFVELMKAVWKKEVPFATSKSWKAPLCRKLIIEAAIMKGYVSKDDPRVKKMLEKQMRGKRKKSHGN